MIYVPLPILTADRLTIAQIAEAAAKDEATTVMPFSSLAQSCKTHGEYVARIAEVRPREIELAAVGLVGPKKVVDRLTGSLPLHR